MTTWQRAPGALWRRSGDRVLVAPPGRDDSVLLEGTGAVTWQLLDPPIAHDDLVAVLADAFDVEAGTVDAEVAPFLAQLADLDAVRAT